jgi:hypothetical protein
MSYFDLPPGERVLREFTIWWDPNRGWVVAETPSLATTVFDSREEAEHFALREAEGDPNRIIFDRKGA